VAGLAVIVIVDGEETYSGLGLLLEKRGHRVTEAVNDSHALDVVNRERPDLILMDTDLTPARSLVVARGLRERSGLHETVIVVVTQQKTARPEGDSLRVAPNDYVIRQGDFEQLKNILNSLSVEAASLVANETGGT
jgi:PleD family two-component response regulator